jgi:hypothetical protein
MAKQTQEGEGLAAPLISAAAVEYVLEVNFRNIATAIACRTKLLFNTNATD